MRRKRIGIVAISGRQFHLQMHSQMSRETTETAKELITIAAKSASVRIFFIQPMNKLEMFRHTVQCHMSFANETIHTARNNN